MGGACSGNCAPPEAVHSVTPSATLQRAVAQATRTGVLAMFLATPGLLCSDIPRKRPARDAGRRRTGAHCPRPMGASRFEPHLSPKVGPGGAPETNNSTQVWDSKAAGR